VALASFLFILAILAHVNGGIRHLLFRSLATTRTALASVESSSVPRSPKGDYAAVRDTAAMPNAMRIGLNMDAQSQYDSRAYLMNYLDNPGFEQGMVGHVVVVGPNPSPSSFTDKNDSYDAVGTGFWNGVNASVRSGTSAGASFPIASYTAGGTYTCKCPALAAGDLIAIKTSNPSLGYVSGHTLPGNWVVNNSDSGITLSTAQHYAGASSVVFDVHDGGGHSIEFGMDSGGSSVGTCSKDSQTLCQNSTDCGIGTCNKAPTYPFHAVTGPMSMSLYALASGTAGAPTVKVTLSRSDSSWRSLSHSFELTADGAWHQYSYSFTGADTSKDTGMLIFTVDAQSGAPSADAKIYVDNAFLGPASGAAGGFRKEVLTTLKTLNPGTLRYMIPQTLTQSDDYFEGSDYEKGPSNDYSVGANFTWYYSLKDMYAIAGAVGANPWVSIPDVFSDADINSFAANLCAAFSSNPFSRAFIEQSNEDWVSGSHTAGGGETVQYGQLANRNFALIRTYMKSKCPTHAGDVYFIVNGQEANGGVLANTSAQIPTDDPHYGGDIADYVPSADEQNTGQTLDQYAALGFKNSLNQFTSGIESNPFTNTVPGNIGNLCGGKLSGCRQFLAVYENGSSNQCGTATPIEAYEMSAGWMAAGFNGQNWILGFSAGSGGINSGTLYPMLAQNTFNFAQLDFTTPGAGCPSGHGTTAALWGIVHDLDSAFGAPFPHIRPIGWAMALANRAIADAYYPMDTSNFTGVYGAAFKSGTAWSALLSNSNNRKVTIQVIFPAGKLPSVGETVLYSRTIADNNENSNSVKIGALPGGITAAGQKVSVTLPPLSLDALEQ
jgi:hypothetical protein